MTERKSYTFDTSQVPPSWNHTPVGLVSLMRVTPPAKRTEALWTSLKHVSEKLDSSTKQTQAFLAIAYAIEKSHKSPEEIAGLFEKLFYLESKTPFQGKSVGIEVEFGAHEMHGGQEREIRLGPFYDSASAMEAIRLARKLTLMCGDDCLSTLHLNFGLTEVQKTQMIDVSYPINDGFGVQKPYRNITEKLAYISNSAARNIRMVTNSDMRLTSYYKQGEYRADFVKPDIISLETSQTETPQRGRLECKGYSLSRDGDVDMLEPIIEATWKAIESPAQAKRLNDDLDTIFSDAAITPPRHGFSSEWAEEYFRRDFGIEYKAVPHEHEAEDGTITYTHTNQLMGRQIGWRAAVTEYLYRFVENTPTIPRNHYPDPSYFDRCDLLTNSWLSKHSSPGSRASTVQRGR